MGFRITYILLFLCLNCFAQKEAAYWYFGEKVGLRFNNSGVPTVERGELDTLEGCASISDEFGNLLFYSDGSTVWSRNHNPMPNGTGLLGDESSTQSAIIIPNPTDPNIYYLFTVGSTVVPTGYHYYTVDMSLNSGFGDVVGGAVNLTDGHGGSEWSEKITAVQGGTCNTFWVISLVSDLYYSYKVDENGVDPAPVISQVDFRSQTSRGYLKVSPDGTKLAAAHQGADRQYHGLYLYSFNNTTGEVLNDGISLVNAGVQVYGVEFSPLAKKLYASTIEDREYSLYQFDLTVSNIKGSAYLVHREDDAFRGALQLGPDLKIYASIPVEYLIGTNYLDVIHDPEADGSACNFEEDYVYFGNDSFSMQGLPPFVQSFFFISKINIVNPNEPVSFISNELSLCYNSSYSLEGDDIPGADYRWTFDDGRIVFDLPTPTPPHILTINSSDNNAAGLYSLTINTNDECESVLIGEANVSFTDPPIINTSTSLSVCDLFDNNANDGLTTFNLNNSLDEITNNDADNFTAYFYLNDTDAENDGFNQNALPEFYANTTPNQIITAKVFKNDSECYSLGQVQLNVSPGTVLPSSNIVGCNSGSGTFDFDLTDKLNTIIADNALPGTVDILFFESIEDAVNNANPISGLYESSARKVYFVATDNGQCYASGSFDLEISPLPPIDMQEETLNVCYLDFPIDLSSSIPSGVQQNFTYEWSTGGNSNEVTVTDEQTITVKVIDKLTLCETIKTYSIVKTVPPEITNVDININTRVVIVNTTEDLGNLYALDDPLGPYQTDNVFNNVGAGIHNIYVKNKFACSLTERKIYVLGFPRYFTPNDDTQNDFWQIKGLNVNDFSISNIQVFDRYGKYLKTLSPNSKWHGVFNGERLPASDYWFHITIRNQDTNETNLYKGHFSLVR